MAKPTEKAPTYLSLDVVALRTGYEVLMEVNGNILLLVGDPRGILD
jgi:hypothetical protein